MADLRDETLEAQVILVTPDAKEVLDELHPDIHSSHPRNNIAYIASFERIRAPLDRLITLLLAELERSQRQHELTDQTQEKAPLSYGEAVADYFEQLSHDYQPSATPCHRLQRARPPLPRHDRSHSSQSGAATWRGRAQVMRPTSSATPRRGGTNPFLYERIVRRLGVAVRRLAAGRLASRGLESSPRAGSWRGFLVLSLYRRTLRELSANRRRVLTGLRALVLLVVLLCLANPVHVIPDARRAHPHTLAILVDRSASMDAVDNRAETRLANALRLWKRHAADIEPRFEAVNFYRFGIHLSQAPSLEAAAQPGEPGEGETHLYDAIHQTLATSPAEIVCLTDGLDTTGEEAAGIVAEAQQKGVSVDFVAGRNRVKPGDSLSIREIQTPSRVMRNTVFTAGSILEINAAKPGEVPVELWSGPTRVAAATLKVRAGANILPWAVPVKAGEPGAVPLEFRLGEGDRQEVAAGTTQIVGKTTVEVLYYQGALQWGYRFLLSALQSDPSFTLTSLLNPALHMQMTSARAGEPSALTDLPENAEKLKRFQIVILAHVFADQLSVRQQNALVQYAKAGGAVFFVTPDTASTAAFAGTPVEQMLPVVFAPQRRETANEAAERTFQQHMAEIGRLRADG